MNKPVEVTNGLISALKSNFANLMLADKNSVAKQMWGKDVLSQEEASIVESQKMNIDNAVDTAVDFVANTVLSNEELSSKKYIFTDAQRAAARLIAPLVQSKEALQSYAKNMSALKPVQLSVSNGITVAAESYGIDDAVNIESAVSNMSLALEAYDGQKLNNAIFYSIAYNLAAARQDAFGEAFFPTVTIDPTQEGIAVSLEFTSLYKEFTRSITGDISKGQFERIPVVKAIYDSSIFATDKQQLVPVYRAGTNDSKFLVDYSYTNKETGESITSAPLLFGIENEYLGLCQTDAMVAKGMMDNTDALDRTIRLSKVYFAINSEDYILDTSLLPFNEFTYKTQDHHKGMALNFNVKTYALDITSVKTAANAESTVFATVAATYPNYKVVYKVNISGEANTFNGTIALFANSIAVADILDSEGNSLDETDAAYVAISAIASVVEFKGYILEAWRTNSNIRTRGKLVTNDMYQQRYEVPLRSGITVLYPVNNINGMDNDAGTLTSQSNLAGVITSRYAVKTLTDFASSMASAQENGAFASMDFKGIARYLVNPYFYTESFDLSSVIDSTQSSHRDSDIREALRLKIRNKVIDMYIFSNFGAAYEVTKGTMGGDVGVVIGTDPRLKSLICKDDDLLDLGAGFKAKVVATLDPLVNGKMFITFSSNDQNRNSEIDPLSFGNCIWAPTAVFEVTKTTSNAVSRELHNQPRFAHIIHLPILSVYEISDVQNVYNKIAIHFNDVTTSTTTGG